MSCREARKSFSDRFSSLFPARPAGAHARNCRRFRFDGQDRATYEAVEPFKAPPVKTESARAACESVLENAGATLPKRDAVDERIVHETRTGTGHVIKWVKDAGGWPDFEASH